MGEFQFREAAPRDSNGILDVYAYYIEHTAVTFEIDRPSSVAFSHRVSEVMKEYPYFVCTRDDTVIGYAYAAKYRERAAYRYDVEVSVYIRNDMHGNGAGSTLYQMLFQELERRGFYNAYACITLPNEKSVALHHKFGFTDIGVHHKTGFKFNEWHDVLWLEKTLKDHTIAPDQ